MVILLETRISICWVLFWSDCCVDFLAPGTLPVSICPQISLFLSPRIFPRPAQPPCSHALLFPPMQPLGAAGHPNLGTSRVCVSAPVPSCPGWSPPTGCGGCRWMKARAALCPAPAAHPRSTAWRAWHPRGCDPARRACTKQTGCDTAAERSSFSSLTPHR